MSSIPVIQKKRGPPPTGQTPVTSIRLQTDVAAGLEAWIAGQPEPRPTRSTAINSALREWLTAKGSLATTDAATVIDDRIELLEAKVASIPDHDGEPSPDAAMNTMKRALAEAELVGLRKKRKRIRTPKPK